MNAKNSVLDGKIIGIIGSPGSGKSFLTERISTLLKCEAIYEIESSFPFEIVQNLRQKKNLFETIVWFRNKQIQNHEYAKILKSEGKTVILDTTFFQHKIYIDLYIKEKFYRDILFEIGRNDVALIGVPDALIYISTTQSLVNKFLTRRKGQFPWEDVEWIQFMSKMAKITDDYMKSNNVFFKNLITLKRDEYDFHNIDDINKLLVTLKKILPKT